MRRFATTLFAPLFCGLLLSIPATMYGQSGTTSNTTTIPASIAESELLRVDEEVFTVGDIARAFARTPGTDSLSFYRLDADSARDFIELYAGFRLKVLEAVDRGLHRRDEFKAEMRRNRDNVALGIGAFGAITGEGYLFQRKVVDAGVEAIWQRRDSEHRVAVIFSSMNPSVPQDTARALKRSIDMLRRIEKGEKFALIAADSTDDPTTKNKGGDLGWVTGGMLPRPMEAAIIETAPGEVYPGIVRLPSGFAVVKVLDRERRTRVRIGHIVFEIRRVLESGNEEEEARGRAEAALSRIKGGESFADVARELSDDRTTAEHGGDLLAYYTRSLGFESRPGKLPPAFEDAVFALEQGEVSGVIADPTVGFRIVKRLEDRLPNFEEEEDALRNIYKRYFFEIDRKAYIASVLEKRGFVINKATLAILLRSIDTTRSASDKAWADGVDASLRKREAFRLGSETWSVADWIDTVETNPRYRGLPLSRQGVATSFENIIEYRAFSQEAEELERDYVEFARLVRDFRDGPLSFELEQTEIYNKVSFDEEAAKAFFAENRDRYKNRPELRLTEVFVYTEREANEVYVEADAGADLGDIAAARTERMGYRQTRGEWPMNGPKHSVLVKTILDKVSDPKAGTIVPPFNSGGGFSVIRIDEVKEPTPQTYQEARAAVLGDYNDYRERTLRATLLDELRDKFPVRIDTKNLDRALSVE